MYGQETCSFFYRNGLENKDELAWALHAKKLSDNECNERNKIWRERRRKENQLVDNIELKERYDLTEKCMEDWKRWGNKP